MKYKTKILSGILYIDTTEFGKVVFILEDKKKKVSKTFKVLPQESGKILVFLEKFLQQNNIQYPISNIQKLIVYKGKGPFTGLRIAAAAAQALSLAWGVPVKVSGKK